MRQPGTLVELAGAYADLERVVLFGEIALRVLQPVQHVAPHRMGKSLDDFVEIDIGSVVHGHLRISAWNELYIVQKRYEIV
ncbi:hypothetical protein D3C78_1719850 [compost metagenome]